MISFALRCDPHAHGFDGWFRSGDDFDRQVAEELVTCPICGTSDVSKALMKPAIGRGSQMKRVGERREAVADAASTVTASTGASKPDTSPSPAATSSDDVGEVAAGQAADVIAKLQAVTRELRAKSDYVGPRFAEEARRIHFGETRHRSIYGEASKDEVEKLSEEGISAIPLPSLPEDAN